MVDTDDTRRTMDAGRRTTPRIWHKLPTGELKKRRIHPVTGDQLMSQQNVMNDLLTITERGQESSRVIK